MPSKTFSFPVQSKMTLSLKEVQTYASCLAEVFFPPFSKKSKTKSKSIVYLSPEAEAIWFKHNDRVDIFATLIYDFKSSAYESLIKACAPKTKAELGFMFDSLVDNVDMEPSKELARLEKAFVKWANSKEALAEVERLNNLIDPIR